MKTKKVLFVVSLVERSLAFEWFFRESLKAGIDFEIVFLHPHEPELSKFCRSLNIRVHHICYRNKSNVLLSFFKLWRLMISRRIQIVHAHLFDASLIALHAAKLAGVSKRIHTRHHASQHHLYNPHAVKYDRLINKQSTHIVAVSESIKRILMEDEKVRAEKITVVHHGFDLNYFEDVDAERIDALKKKYALGQAQQIVGVISRWTHWKGIQFVIPAFKNLLVQYPSAVLLLANAKGEYEQQIEQLLSELPALTYRKIIFEEDTPALYQLMDVFVHVPIDDHSEAFGQVYVEALAAGVPSVFTLSGIANEFVRDHYNAITVPYQNVEAITNGIAAILSKNILRQELIKNGKSSVKMQFDITRMVDKMKTLYE